MKKNILIATLIIMVSFICVPKVNAAYSQSFSLVDGQVFYPVDFDGGLSKVRYARVDISEAGTAKYMVNLIRQKSGYDTFTITSFTLTISGNNKIIYFIPQDMECPPTFTSCVKVSASKPGASESYISDQSFKTGIQIVKKSLLGTLNVKGKLTLYYS